MYYVGLINGDQRVQKEKKGSLVQQKAVELGLHKSGESISMLDDLLEVRIKEAKTLGVKIEQ